MSTGKELRVTVRFLQMLSLIHILSNHFAKPEWHIENISSATGTHDLHAAGVARAMVYYGHKGVAITSHGESATSEGFVYEAINGASLERLPVIFVIQDNGYGISVPKSEQTANRKVAENFSGFKNLKIIYCLSLIHISLHSVTVGLLKRIMYIRVRFSTLVLQKFATRQLRLCNWNKLNKKTSPDCSKKQLQ